LLTGLTSNTLYHVRAYATNVSGTGYGDETSFTTLDSISPVERTILIELYNSTNGDSWTDNTGWKAPPLHTDGFAMPGTEGNWFGITISSAQVTKISLFNNNLTGNLPVQLGNLAALSELILAENSISGSIPVEIGNLSNLWLINFSNNQLSGSIPASIGNLTNLGGLSIEYNHLTGTIPHEIGNLVNLNNWINLAHNQLEGVIPEEIGNLTLLRQLDLRENLLSGSIPPQLGNLSNLEWLFLFKNQLSGNIPNEIGDLSQLRYLELADNQLSGEIPLSIGNLSQLDILSLNSNKLSGVIPVEFTNLSALTSMNVGFNALQSEDPDVNSFLSEKDPDWYETQTIAPDNLSATPVNSSTVNLTWNDIPYTGATGGYRIFVGTASGGPYTFFQQTSDKTITSLPVTGLNPGTPYYFVIQTRTDVHSLNQNVVDSDYSAETTATTIPVYTVTFTAGSGGTLSGTITQVVEHGSSCTPVMAEPDTSYHFVDWTGDYNGTANPLTILNVTSDMTITANFAINQYTVTFVEGPNGTITGDKVQTVNHGSSTSEVTAVPGTGYGFVDLDR